MEGHYSYSFSSLASFPFELELIEEAGSKNSLKQKFALTESEQARVKTCSNP